VNKIIATYAFMKNNFAAAGLMNSKYSADAVINKEDGREIIKKHTTEAALRKKILPYL
jgi:hypothetical protein